ncbi:WXG100 family type VII secretion target [Streptomyces sp. NPDC006668]|uniref:WXG100 family type VII secretion target n=1 Tax=Streptomyces sp. NPDC006668 TaxID=3156903 RepID=UPI0033F82234
MGNEDKYNQGPFKKDGSGIDSPVFASSDGTMGQVSDYDSWDWKQIEAAINGFSAGTNSGNNVSRARGASDPQSLQDAADGFYQVQVALQSVAEVLQEQGKALAGVGGPWKGDAADAFHDMIVGFSRQVHATANVLSGGATGGNSVPQQLANNAVNLRNAQHLITEIDQWYARQAQLAGASTMKNGLIKVSEQPQVVDMMTNDMRKVLKSLASEYQVTIDSVHTPSPVNPPGGGGDMNQPGTGDGPGTPGPGTGDAPGTPGPGTGDAPGAGMGGGSPFTGGAGVGGSGGGVGGGAPDPTSLADLGIGSGAGGLSPLTDRGGVGGEGGGFGGFPGVPMTPGIGGGALGTGGEPTESSGLLDPSAEPWKGGNSLGDGDLLPTGGLNLPERGRTKRVSLAGGLTPPEEFTGPTDVGASGAGGLGRLGVMPMVPGMGGGVPGVSGDEPSDASGLVDPSVEPWKGDSGAAGEDPLPTAEGLGDRSGLKPWAGSPEVGTPGAGVGGVGAGMPGMPMVPGMGGGVPGVSGDEPSDASGLVDPSVEPWKGDTGVAGEDSLPTAGVSGGGNGLTLPAGGPTAPVSLAGGAGSAEPWTGSGAGAGMPYMPPMGGASGAGGKGGGEPSDASGLLEASTEPWTGERGAAMEDVAPGTPAGGPGLGIRGGRGTPVAAVTPVVGIPPGAGERERASEERRWQSAELVETDGSERGVGVPVELERDTVGEDGAENSLPHDRVAIVQPSADEELEDITAWDEGGWSLGGGREDEEEEIFEPGYSTEVLMWTGEAQSAAVTTTADQDGESEEAGEFADAHATARRDLIEEAKEQSRRMIWKPNRSGAAAQGLSGTMPMTLTCGLADDDDEEDETQAAEAEAAAASDEEQEEEDGGNTVAKLLHQDEGAWGIGGKGADAFA